MSRGRFQVFRDIKVADLEDTLNAVGDMDVEIFIQRKIRYRPEDSEAVTHFLIIAQSELDDDKS